LFPLPLEQLVPPLAQELLLLPFALLLLIIYYTNIIANKKYGIQSVRISCGKEQDE